ncbi:MAG: purine-binding chemotaxis protein CheW [Desulfarculus sp.]|nr:purine-binding chemotaxis protein CheW [Desulfarculus sp.]
MKTDASLLPSAGGPAPLAGEGKYLTFALGEEEYGVGILKVREIIGMMPIRPIPQTPEFIKGVLNLRGKVIPVIDLRVRFCLEAKPYDERTCIIVVEARGGPGHRAMGVVVDSVNEVTNIRQEQVEPTPSFGVSLDTAYILGIAKSGDAVRILLDIDQVLGADELAQLGQAA